MTQQLAHHPVNADPQRAIYRCGVQTKGPQDWSEARPEDHIQRDLSPIPDQVRKSGDDLHVFIKSTAKGVQVYKRAPPQKEFLINLFWLLFGAQP